MPPPLMAMPAPLLVRPWMVSVSDAIWSAVLLALDPWN